MRDVSGGQTKVRSATNAPQGVRTLFAVAMTTNELRAAFQRFYEERGHLRVPAHSLVPDAEDQTTLFIIAGMQQFKPYFLRTKEPPSKRVVSVQPCLRAGGKDNDLDEVGRTDRHCSFFEMMGNFSFGDYYKDEAVDFAWEWVTDVLGLEPERLWATVHEGDPMLELGEDTVAIEAWRRVGIPAERIVRLGKDNFWQAGETGPCGQCTEIFYDRGEIYACGDPNCGPGHCDRIMEIYNLVFMAYDLQPGNVLVPLPTPNVDTGNGIERTACVLQDVSSVFDTDGFRVIMDWIERESGVAYNESRVSQRAHRVLADHGRAVTFLIAEGIEPSNEGRGYICRRLLRRAIYQAKRIGLDGVHRLPAVVVEQMGDAYPMLREHAEQIERIVRAEEEKFSETLARGMKVFEDLAGQEAITAEDAFALVATYGFPIELAQELAEERGQALDMDGFHALMEGHREVSRGGGEDTTQQVAAQLVGAGKRATEFVGYSKTDVLTAVIDTAPAGGTRQFVKLEQSPFYAAGGGQVSDQGYLAVDGEQERLEIRRRPEVRRRPGARRRALGSLAADTGHACAGGRELERPVPDAGEPHRDASAAPGAARRARRPRQAGGLRRSSRQAALRLHARAPVDAGGTRARRADRQRQGVRGDPGPDVRDADRGGSQARGDDALRGEVRRRGAGRRDR